MVGLVDCVSPTSSPGPSGSTLDRGACVLANPRPLPKPVPFRGAQLLFQVPDELIPGVVRSARRLSGAVQSSPLFTAAVDVTPLFSLRENVIVKEPGWSYPEP